MASILTHPLGSSRFFNLVGMAGRYGIEWRYGLRFVGVAAQSFLRQPVFKYETIRYQKKILNQEIVSSPVFIIGHWRSGTTHLQNLLSCDPQFGGVTLQQAAMPLDFLSLGWLLSGALAKSLPSRRLMDNVAVYADAPWEEELALACSSPLSFYHVSFFPKGMREIFSESIFFNGGRKELIRRWWKDYQFFLKKVQMTHPGKQLLLKNPANTARISWLLKAFPDAKFIHIHRDPYEVFSSSIHLYLKAQIEWGFHRADRNAIVEQVMETYPLLMREYFRQKQQLRPNQLTEVRFDDLTSNPMCTLETIYRKLNLSGFFAAAPQFSKYLESVRGYQKNDLNLEKEERLRIEEFWSDIFETLGYPNGGRPPL